jgi:hypothetical protein
MSELTEDHINIILSGSIGGLVLTVISYIMRKYFKSSKCHNALIGDLELTSVNQSVEDKTTEEVIGVEV